MKVIITIPAYNESNTIGHLIKDIREVMNKTRYKYDILVVNDGSTDNTAEIAKKNNAIVFSHFTKRGLAETYKTEMKKCLELNADIIVHIDADSQYDPKDIPRLIKPIENNEADLVLGNRFKGGIEYMPLIKKIGNKTFSKAISNIIKFKIGDVQTGFRAMNKEIAKIPIISTHTYTQETVIRAVRENKRVKEIPTYFAKRHGKSKLMKNPFEYAFKAWINIFRVYRDYEPLKFFGVTGGVFFLIGFIIGIWLFYLFLTTGKIGHIPSAVLAMLLMVMGIQIILFGFLADMNKK